MYFVLMGEWNPPEYVIHTRGDCLTHQKESTCYSVLKVIAVRLAHYGFLLVTLACIPKGIHLSMFPKGIHFRKSLTKSEGSDQF